MPHIVKRIAKGNTAKVNAYAGPAGELVMDTTTNDLVLETGTAGGVRMAKASTAIAANNGIEISAGGTLGQNTTVSGVGASTSAPGVVQLNNATNSTAQNQAATPKAVSDALQAAKDYADTVAGGAAPDVSNATGTLSVAHGGTGLTSSPSMLTNLGSTTADNVLKASPRPGITGTLPVANGGTGLTSSPSMLTNLGSTTADNVLKASPRPGVTGVLPIANGGTGSATQNFVDLTTAQTVGGVKTLTANPVIKNISAAITLQQTDIDKGTIPTANHYSSILFVDKDGTATENRTGLITNQINKNTGLTFTGLYAYQFADAATSNAMLAVYCSADGNTRYAVAPTPAAGDNSTKIATTAWVAANAPSFSGTVTQKATRTTTGNWTISGLTVGKPLIIGINGHADLDHAAAFFRVISGSDIGKGNYTATDNGNFSMGHRYYYSTPPSFALVPTATTVVLQINILDTSITIYAYQ